MLLRQPPFVRLLQIQPRVFPPLLLLLLVGGIGALYLTLASRRTSPISISRPTVPYSASSSSHCSLTSSVVHPTFSNQVALSPNTLAKRVAFVFIHVNKAGGTLIKEEVLRPAAQLNKWDGGGYGTVEFQHLRTCQPQHHIPDEGLACGRLTDLSLCGPVRPHGTSSKCLTRAVWGSWALGHCANTTLPCVQVIVLREPVQRLISQYNYVCVDGREGQKKWLGHWKEQGRCPLTLLEFMDMPRLTTPALLIKRLTGTRSNEANSECGLELAKRNLMHPCMRYLLLDRLQDGLARLAKTWGPVMQPFLRKVATAPKRNSSPYPERTLLQSGNATIVAQVARTLHHDVRLYKFAVEHYEEQWTRELQSCNEYAE